MNDLSATAAVPATKAGYLRWRICALLLFATTINYVDRQVLGVLAPDLQKIIGWNEIQYGYIVTAFQAAYAIGLVSAGAVIDRLGTRGVHASVPVLTVSLRLARLPEGSCARANPATRFRALSATP